MLRSTSHFSKSNICFFIPREEQSSPVLEGKFDYNEAFKAFLAATNQKAQTADIVGRFLNQLQQRNKETTNNNLIKVADIGCADGAACLGYIQSLHCNRDFEYMGIDINDKFLEDAQNKLSAEPLIKKASLINGDILLDGLESIPAEQHHSFDVIFISHLAYYLQNADYSLQLMKNMSTLLNENGMAIFLHEDSTYHFRSTYNSNYKNVNAPKMLRESAEVLENQAQFNEISFTSSLNFKKMSDEQWEAIKNPALYKKFSTLPDMIDNLNKLSFIVQCDLMTLFEEGSLSSYINEMKQILTQNNYCFDLKTTMQVLISSVNTHSNEIKGALSMAVLSESNSKKVEQSDTPEQHSTQLCYS